MKSWGSIIVIDIQEVRQAYRYCAPSGSHRHHWVCQCSCGEIVEIYKYSISVGKTNSCGCLSSDVTRAQNLTPWLSGTVEHQTWKRMVSRCYSLSNQVYKNYGGRGITVCQRWRESFVNFLSDVGHRPPNPPGKKRWYSLDRIDNNGNYEPGNVRWATPKQQTNNQRTNRLVTVGGQIKPLYAAAMEHGVNYTTVTSRPARVNSLEEALKTL